MKKKSVLWPRLYSSLHERVYGKKVNRSYCYSAIKIRSVNWSETIQKRFCCQFTMRALVVSTAIFWACRVHSEKSALYSITNRLSKQAWAQTSNSFGVAKSKIECGSLCSHFQDSCNAFSFNDGICRLAEVTFLEEDQSGVERETFYLQSNEISKLKVIPHPYGLIPHFMRRKND